MFTVAEGTNTIKADLVPTYIEYFQCIVLGKALEDQLRSLCAQLRPVQVKLCQGIIGNQKLLQPGCRIIPQIILRDVKHYKRVDICEMAKDGSDCRIIDVVGLYVEFLKFAIFLYFLVVDHLREDIHASSSYFVVGEVDASHSAEVGDDQIAEICMDVVIRKIDLLKNPYLLYDLSHCLYRYPAA